MTLWVKICGLTTPEGIDAAVGAGADAIGFVFAPSRRRVTAEQAVELAKDVPSRVQRVAVMLHPDQSLVDEVWTTFHPDILQTDLDDLAALRIPPGLRVLPVLRSAGTQPANLPQRLLFEGPVSGTGETADWSQAAKFAAGTELVLAGGLNPSNVAAAVAVVRPWGVDVSSGVEREPGVKDPARIVAFVRAARAGETE